MVWYCDTTYQSLPFHVSVGQSAQPVLTEYTRKHVYYKWGHLSSQYRGCWQWLRGGILAATGFLTNKATLSNALLVVVVVGESLLIKVNWFLPTVQGCPLPTWVEGLHWRQLTIICSLNLNGRWRCGRPSTVAVALVLVFNATSLKTQLAPHFFCRTSEPIERRRTVDVLPLWWSAVNLLMDIGEYSSIDNFSPIGEYLSVQKFNQLLFVHMFFPTLGSIRIVHQLRGHTYRLTFEKTHFFA